MTFNFKGKWDDTEEHWNKRKDITRGVGLFSPRIGLFSSQLDSFPYRIVRCL